MDSRAPMLLERDAELDAINRAIAAASAGDGRAVLLEGAAGVGKTTLLREAARRAERQGLSVLRARGDELERDFPWGLAIQLFAGEANRLISEGGMEGPAALTRPLFEEAVASAESAQARFPLLHGLHWLTSDLAERTPLVLLMDDAHFCDAETLSFVHYLLGRLDGLGASLLIGIRLGEPAGAEHEQLLARIRAHPGTESRMVHLLGGSAMRAVVESALPDADAPFLDALVEAAAGNPFLCRELLAAIGSEGIEPVAASAARVRDLRPDGVRRSILVRLGRLGEDAGRLAAAAAVLGRSATPRLTAQVAELEPAVAAAAVEALTAAGLLESSETSLDFVHPIIRDVVHADLSRNRLRRYHLVAARLLRARGGPAEEVAPHLLLGDPADEGWAVETMREAAASDLARGAPARAGELLRAALEYATEARVRTDLLIELGQAEAAAGLPSAAERYRQALQLVPTGPRAAAIALALGETLHAGGRFADSIDACKLGLDLIEAAPPGERDPALEARLLANLDTPGQDRAHRPRRVAERMDAIVAAPPAAPDTADRVLMAMAASERALAGEGSSRHAIELARQSLGDADDPSPDVVVELAALALLFSHEPSEARAVLEPVIQDARARGQAAAYVNLLSLHALALRAHGSLALAAAEAADVVRIAEEGPGAAPPISAPGRQVLALASLDRGEPEEAAAAVDVPRADELWGASPLYGWFLHARGAVELAHGRHDAALDAFRAAGESFAAAHGTGNFCDWRSGAAVAAHACGRRDEALELAGEELALARRFGAPRALGIALRAGGLVSEQDDESIEMLRDAVTVLTSSEAPLELARALVDLGAAVRRAGWDRDSREPLRDGMEEARRCGARALVDRAAAELEASGASRPRLALSGLESLTPSQRRVAEMAAGGASNAQIAAALFVTKRTVETHLTATYGKLAIGSRAELAAALREPAPGVPHEIGNANGQSA